MPSLPASYVNFTHLCLWMLLNCTNIFATYFWSVQDCSVRDIDKRLFFFLFTNIIFVLYALIVHFHRIAYTKAYARNWQILIPIFFSYFTKLNMYWKNIFYFCYCCLDFFFVALLDSSDDCQKLNSRKHSNSHFLQFSFFIFHDLNCLLSNIWIHSMYGCIGSYKICYFPFQWERKSFYVQLQLKSPDIVSIGNTICSK